MITALLVFVVYAAVIIMTTLLLMYPEVVRRPRPRNRRRHNLARFLSASPSLWTSRR